MEREKPYTFVGQQDNIDDVNFLFFFSKKTIILLFLIILKTLVLIFQSALNFSRFCSHLICLIKLLRCFLLCISLKNTIRPRWTIQNLYTTHQEALQGTKLEPTPLFPSLKFKKHAVLMKMSGIKYSQSQIISKSPR